MVGVGEVWEVWRGAWGAWVVLGGVLLSRGASERRGGFGVLKEGPLGGGPIHQVGNSC